MSQPPDGGEGHSAASGELVLVSTPIGNLGDLSPRAAAALGTADVVCCEDTRHTGAMLKRLDIAARQLKSLHAHNEAERVPWLLSELASGRTVALVSDAGTPAVSDPGERLVAAAAEAGFRITVVPGPSAVLAALVVSGMRLDRWRFEGFLPRSGAARRARLADVASSPCPSVCFEAPHRIAATLADLATVCGAHRPVAVCREMTKLHEEVLRTTLGGAAARVAEVAPRGEFVLVVGGTPAEGAELPSAGELAAEVESLVGAGLSRRDAVREVSARRGVGRSAVYDAAVKAVPQQGGAPRDR